jgi:(R,R)-butanediol dehydrogenase/meso-butanediol dehydrogenase/diacetyl reductase
MQAAMYYGQRDVRVEDIAEPTVGSDEVLVDIGAAGICGSDLHEYTAGPISIPTDSPHPLTGVTTPVPMGHEFGGTIGEIGENVREVTVGDVVAVNPILSCGDCPYCNTGRQNICESLGFIGLSGGGGGFSQRIVVPSQNVIELREGMTPTDGALIEPFSVGVHAVRQSPLQLGDTVAVVGAGPIGLMVIQAARSAGAERIFASEPHPDRRRLATECGADIAVDPTAESLAEQVQSETDVGVDIAFEVAGLEPTLDQAIKSTKRGGHTTVVSVFEDRVAVEVNDISMLERSVNGTRAYHAGGRAHDDYEIAVGMLAEGHFDAEPLVTDHIALSNIVEDGFEQLLKDKSSVKILIDR